MQSKTFIEMGRQMTWIDTGDQVSGK